MKARRSGTAAGRRATNDEHKRPRGRGYYSTTSGRKARRKHNEGEGQEKHRGRYTHIFTGDESNYNVLKLPANLTAIEEEAFQGTTADVIMIPAGCTKIGARAFSSCRHLKEIYIPEMIADMDPTVFSKSRTQFIVSDNEEVQEWADANGVYWIYE